MDGKISSKTPYKRGRPKGSKNGGHIGRYNMMVVYKRANGAIETATLRWSYLKKSESYLYKQLVTLYDLVHEYVPRDTIDILGAWNIETPKRKYHRQ